MLDIRVDGFTVPLAEVELGPITPAVAFANIADEGAYLTGLVRVYRISTGLMVYDSQLTPSTIPAGGSAVVEALTPWLPPGVAEDDYFVNGWASAVSTGCEKVPWSGNIPSFYFDITAPPPGPYPDPHASTHEAGGSDPVALVHANLSGLDADDHPQYKLRDEVLYESDFLQLNTYWYLMSPPWTMPTLASGSAAPLTGEAEHPGIYRFSSSTSANSGVACRLHNASILLAGSESARLVFRPQTLALTTLRFGFLDTTNHLDAVDGVYVEALAGTMSGKTASNSVRSTTGTNYLLVTNTWYNVLVELNSDASLATFTLYSEAGAVLWTSTLATNIPTAAGRETGSGVLVSNSGTSAVALLDPDYINVRIARSLVR